MTLIIELYVLLGFLYTLINVYIRKLNADDPLLVLVWLFLWPLGVLSLVVLGITELVKKIKHSKKTKYHGVQGNNDHDTT